MWGLREEFPDNIRRCRPLLCREWGRLNFAGCKALVFFFQLALGGVNRHLTANIQNIYAELALASLPENFRTRTRPMVAQQTEGQLLEIVVVPGDRKSLRDGRHWMDVGSY
jgi:hypothetical protein